MTGPGALLTILLPSSWTWSATRRWTCCPAIPSKPSPTGCGPRSWWWWFVIAPRLDRQEPVRALQVAARFHRVNNLTDQLASEPAPTSVGVQQLANSKEQD